MDDELELPPVAAVDQILASYALQRDLFKDALARGEMNPEGIADLLDFLVGDLRKYALAYVKIDGLFLDSKRLAAEQVAILQRRDAAIIDLERQLAEERGIQGARLNTAPPPRCPDCGQAVTPPPDASGPTTARCGRCGYVVGMRAPWRDREVTITEAVTTDAGARPTRRRSSWRR